MMEKKKWDTTRCHNEDLAHIGEVQALGVAAFFDTSEKCAAISENCAIIGVSGADDWLGQSAAHVLQDREWEFVESSWSKMGVGQDPMVLSSARRVGGVLFSLTVHYIENQGLLLEWERQLPNCTRQFITLPTTLAWDDSVNRLLDYVEGVQVFDRVFIYRFEEDGSGEVIAERNHGFSESYLGLRYSDTDIPACARKLYFKNPIRLIHDVQQENTPLLCLPDMSLQTLDLSDSVMRGVSAFHKRYMTNMGVRSSCSVAILARGKLWGLVGMQSHSPIQLDHSRRAELVHFAKAFSVYILQKDAEQFMRFFDKHESMLKSFAFEVDEHTEISMETLEFFMQYFGADGLARFRDGHWFRWGVCPTTKDLDTLFEELVESGGQSGKVQTDRLQSHYPGSAFVPKHICGLSAVWSDSAQPGERTGFLFFKKEAVQSVVWGSRKTKADLDSVSPMASFGRWRELRKGCSLPWSPTSRNLLLALQATVIREVQVI